MSKPRVFRDETLQNEFDTNGFVKFKMFSQEQINRLHRFYTDTREEHETVIDIRKFHATNDTDNPDLIAKTDEFIKQVMLEEIDKHFLNYKTISASFLLKQPDEASELGPHQDLRFVDEENFYSFNIWVATEATNKYNGGLRFLKGSHLLHNTIRALPTYPWKYRDVAPLIPSYLTDISTEPGDCVILNHACIHASYPNLSGHIRVAAIVAMIPQGAEIVHYYLPDGDPQYKVEQYAMTLDDFIHLKGGQRPQGARLIGAFHHDFAPMDVKDFRKWAGNAAPEKKSTGSAVYHIKTRLIDLFKNRS